MPKSIEVSKTASIRHIALSQDNSLAVYSSDLNISMINAHRGTIVTKYVVENQIIGLHYNKENSNILFACDNSFGFNMIDNRTKFKNTIRMNSTVQNHNATCSSVSNNYVAIASSTDGTVYVDVDDSTHKEQYPHVVSVYDIRNFNEPITTFARRHTEQISCMSFTKNGDILMTGTTNGAFRAFNCDRRDEDSALISERRVKGPVTNIGLINKNLVFVIGDKAECNLFDGSKNELNVLYGNVMNTATEQSKKISPATFTKPNFVVGLIKGQSDELPIISVWGTEGQNKLHLTAINKFGTRQKKNLTYYVAHEGDVHCMAADAHRIVTGGDDGKIIIKNVDFRKDGCVKSSESDTSAEEKESLTDIKASRSSSDTSLQTTRSELQM